MRQLRVVVVALTLLSVAAAQSLRVDEPASKVVLRERTYTVVLVANSTNTVESATVRLEVIAPGGSQLASSSSPARLKTGANKLSASVTLDLPKKNEDLLWYRLAYKVTANGTEPARGILPLFESVQDFALHVSAPAMVQPGRKFFVRVQTSHPVLGRAVGGVAITGLKQSAAAASGNSRQTPHSMVGDVREGLRRPPWPCSFLIALVTQKITV